MMRIGVFLPNWVGDACMATPAVRALRQGFSRNAELIGICRPLPAEVFRDSNWFQQMLVFRPGGGRGVLSRRQLVAQLRKEKLDTILLLTNSLTTALIAKLSGAKRRVGYDRDARSLLLTDALTVPRIGFRLRPIPAIDYYLALASHLGCPSVDRAMEIGIGQDDRERADDAWQQFGWDANRPTVVLNSSGAFGHSRLWPSEHLVGLAKQIASQKEYQVLLHSGPAERKVTNDAAKRAASPFVRSLGEIKELPIGLSKAVIQRSIALVTTDSGPRHLAVALNKPVVSLFGSSHPTWTQTYNQPETVLFEGLSCQPCYRRKCPLVHQNCMRKLTVDRVYRALLRRIAETPQQNKVQTPLSEAA